jgi:hypothetical protein
VWVHPDVVVVKPDLSGRYEESERLLRRRLRTDCMATESQSQRQAHVLAVTRTGIAAGLGVLAAFGSWFLTQDMSAAAASRNQTAQLLVGVAIIVQPLLQQLLGVYKDDFGAKDFLFIVFITFAMWFVTWTIILTSGAHAEASTEALASGAKYALADVWN